MGASAALQRMARAARRRGLDDGWTIVTSGEATAEAEASERAFALGDGNPDAPDWSSPLAPPPESPGDE